MFGLISSSLTPISVSAKESGEERTEVSSEVISDSETEPAEKEYSIYVEAFGGNIDMFAWREQQIIRAGWGSSLDFALAERDTESGTSTREQFNLSKGARPVKGASWEAVLPDGTIAKPFATFIDVDSRHTFDEETERKKWEQEYARFEVPLEMTGPMTIRASVDGVVVAEYSITVIDQDRFGKPIRGKHISCGKWFFILEDGTLARGWLKKDGNWYYANEDGVLQTGWQYISYEGEKDWYYLSKNRDNYGKMCRGWTKVNGIWYYLRKDGTLASNEWYRGYWASKDGSWKYQPKGSWKKDKNGWWFGDTSGWYAKNQSMKIDGVLYTFDAEGYLVD